MSSPLAVIVVPLSSFPQVLNLLDLKATTKMMTTTMTQSPSKPFVIVTIPMQTNSPTDHQYKVVEIQSLAQLIFASQSPVKWVMSPEKRCFQPLGGPLLQLPTLFCEDMCAL